MMTSIFNVENEQLQQTFEKSSYISNMIGRSMAGSPVDLGRVIRENKIYMMFRSEIALTRFFDSHLAEKFQEI